MEALVVAIGFSKLKNPKLGLTDTLTFGKLAGCRICDVAQDHYEYLIWAEKSGFVKFQPEVITLIQEQASFAAWKIYEEQEVKPWFEDDLLQREREMIRSIQDDDIPF
jgi:uncharacterized protein (DUF3820 family)